jgi:CBS domain-containing protein
VTQKEVRVRIADILATKGSTVTTIAGDASVGDAVAALELHRIGALVVSPDGARIDGIMSERDVVRLLATEPAGLLERSVRAIMSSPVRTCEPDGEVAAVMALMTDQRIRHVPVVDGDALCGIVSIGDVVKAMIAQLEQDRRTLEEYIGAR